MFEAIFGATDGLRKSTASPFALGWRDETLMLGEIELSCEKFDPSYADASLTSVYGRDVARRAIPYIERAVAAKREGALALSLTHLALAGLPRLPDPEAARERAHPAQSLIKRGVSPATIIAALDDKSALRREYDPDQPRVPAGNGRDSGRWTKDDGAEGDPTAPTPDETVHPPSNEVQIADNSNNWLQYLNPVDDASAAERDGSPFNGAGPNDQHTRAVDESIANFRAMGLIVNDADREYHVKIPGFSTDRVYDFIAFNPDTGEYVAVEVKSTKYDAVRFNLDQVEKDASIYVRGGVPLADRLARLTSVAYDTACDGCENLRFQSVYLHAFLLFNGVTFYTRHYIQRSK